jgi:hypothetical protein
LPNAACPLALLLIRGVDAALDQIAPASCFVARFFERQLAIGAERTRNRVFRTAVPSRQNEGAMPGRHDANTMTWHLVIRLDVGADLRL